MTNLEEINSLLLDQLKNLTTIDDAKLANALDVAKASAVLAKVICDSEELQIEAKKIIMKFDKTHALPAKT